MPKTLLLSLQWHKIPKNESQTQTMQIQPRTCRVRAEGGSIDMESDPAHEAQGVVVPRLFV